MTDFLNTAIFHPNTDEVKRQALKERIEARSWDIVQRVEGMTECWIWRGGKTDKGYGHLRNGKTMVKVHRWALEQKLGRPIGKGLFALHSCDQRDCMNPDHLREGTAKQNAQDCAARGRGNQKGLTRLHAAPETWAVVERMAAHGATGKQIHEATGISVQHIHNVLNGNKPWPQRYLVWKSQQQLAALAS